jgi:tetratricopeptide (TPR) repeat protein
MAAMPTSIDDAPTPDEIRSAIDRITASDVFSRSPQLGAFLRFVAEAVLRGKADRIKAYTIGIEVLRRDTRFDPQIDPIVRVEATRLRRAIERYYAGPGLDDPIVVDLPRGAYVPTFRCRDVVVPPAFSLAQGRDWIFARPMLAGLAALIAVTAVVAGVLPRRADLQRDAAAVVASLPPGNGMPLILIEPPHITGTPRPGGHAAAPLFEKIGNAFARFDTINVAYGSQPSGTANALPVDYRLIGAIEYRDGQPSAQFRLVDAAEGKVVWTRSFEGVAAASDGEIVRALTEALLQSYGVIRARDRAKHLVSGSGDPRYRCILEAADSLRTLNRNEHERARKCLENLTAADPSFAVGYAFLALIYSREHQFGLPLRPDEVPALDRALVAVRRSIELNPASSRAYVVLMVVLFHRREVDEAFAAGEKAIALNKFDMLGPAEYGGRLILAGQVDRGMAMLRHAGEAGAIRPAWQHFYMFMGAYLAGDLKEAAYQSGQITADNYYCTHLSRTLLAVAAGDRQRAAQSFDRLVALQPGWHTNPAKELSKLTPNPDIAARLGRELSKLGNSGT